MDKINLCVSVSNEKGSTLIGLIATMVIVAILGAGMLYLTSTSAFNELYYGSHSDAFAVAEAGGRYAKAVIRDAYANDKSRMNSINANQTFTLASGSRFQITNVVETVISNTATVTFSSTGMVGSGLLTARRKIDYIMQPANQSASGNATPGAGQGIPDLATLPGNVATGSMGFSVVNVNSDQALQVTKDQGNGVNAEAYVFVPPANPNPFYTNWNATGGYSSYDLQVKIATGTLSGGQLSNPPSTYANGLVFRGVQRTGQQQTFLGISLVRNTVLSSVTPEFSATWVSGHAYAIGDIVQYTDDNYYQCIQAVQAGTNIKPTNTSYWKLFSQDRPMIVLWVRISNQGNGEDKWLAYKLLDPYGRDFVVDSSGFIKNWSTIFVRIVEAASVKLSVTSAPLIKIGDIISGGGGTARVFRIINETDANGGQVILLLNNIVGTFSRPAMIGSYNTDTTWGYRSRDNYVWVFYTDTGDHSSNATPLETSGSNNVRLGQSRGTIEWPVTDVQSWSSAADKYSLVNWSGSLNTSLDATIRILGNGKEAGAIIRTKIETPQTTRPGPYNTNADFPGEIGVVSLGGQSDCFFDDLAYYIRGGYGTGGGSDGSGTVIQNP